MTFAMKASPEHNYIQNYEDAVSRLSQAPDDRDLQHKAVLSLARMGSLGFAISEYGRYGLSEVRRHEDIMALGGRLAKDQFLGASGKTALEHARTSAALYEAAFKDTGGYYSGINAATMAYLADMPAEIVMARVEHILGLLPLADKLTPTDHYFVEATRAECFLLKSDLGKAQMSLRLAVEFDPLNYAAHATTIKQFRLILNKRKSDQIWLKQFMPPRPIHYAGHIWGDDVSPSLIGGISDLGTMISDRLQQGDIGFSYGSLAAGADILFAEALLEEGGALHIVLPLNVESFKQKSVVPFGPKWAKRFEVCLEQASSVTTLNASDAPDHVRLNIIAARMAMGQAILKAREFDVEASQFLIQSDTRPGSFTHHHARDWAASKREQIILPIDMGVSVNLNPHALQDSIPTLLMRSDDTKIISFETVEQAAAEAIKLSKLDKGLSIALQFDLPGAEHDLKRLLQLKLPSTIMMSEACACSLTLLRGDRFSVTYAGLLNGPNNNLRSYTLR